MQTSEDKDRGTLAWVTDLELKHSSDSDHRSILRIIKEMQSRAIDLTMRISRIEEKLGITEPAVVPGD